MKDKKLIKNKNIPTQDSFKETGFTLVETLVAITILLISIVGPLTIASKGLSSAGLAKERISAFYLAQEGVELVRNQRDLNVIAGSGWLNGLNNCLGSQGCFINPLDGIISSCPGGGCEAIKKNQNQNSNFYNLYGYSFNNDWVKSPFTRTIKISTINSQEINLAVEVSWLNKASVIKKVLIEEHLFNWQ